MIVHVVPVNDLVEHDDIGDECICGVSIEAVKGEDGSVRWVITHHSLDGRELDE